jgi:hypothetical protein
VLDLLCRHRQPCKSDVNSSLLLSSKLARDRHVTHQQRASCLLQRWWDSPPVWKQQGT